MVMTGYAFVFSMRNLDRYFSPNPDNKDADERGMKKRGWAAETKKGVLTQLVSTPLYKSTKNSRCTSTRGTSAIPMLDIISPTLPEQLASGTSTATRLFPEILILSPKRNRRLSEFPFHSHLIRSSLSRLYAKARQSKIHIISVERFPAYGLADSNHPGKIVWFFSALFPPCFPSLDS